MLGFVHLDASTIALHEPHVRFGKASMMQQEPGLRQFNRQGLEGAHLELNIPSCDVSIVLLRIPGPVTQFTSD